jgi:O-antigen biosynthesis protein WbqP
MRIKIFALLLLFLLSPIFIILAMAIFIEDGFPIFYTQKRFGADCKKFDIFKFRSMKNDTPEIATHLLNSPHIYLLKVGKFIRNYSLDELPNLINIIKGEMTFVGPRPALHNQNDLINYRISLGVSKLKPGITGWAQINGRDEISLAEKVNLEFFYLKNKSFFLDFIIIYKTFFKVISKKGIKH